MAPEAGATLPAGWVPSESRRGPIRGPVGNELSSRAGCRAGGTQAGQEAPMSDDRGLRLVHSADPPDPDVLVARVARGDSAAFEALYDALGALVHGLARRVVRDPSRAEDVTQEVFLDVWRKAP